MSEDQPIEVATDHGCLLRAVTDELAAVARVGCRGAALGERANAALARLSAMPFAECCMPAYLALAPVVFEREIQLPVASSEVAQLDTRVLLWPVGAADGQHPHRDGWATVMAAQGDLVVSEEQAGVRAPERHMALHTPELILPVEGISHHIHNRGQQVGLSVHIFGT